MSLSLIFNPLTSAFDYIDDGGAYFQAPVATEADLPLTDDDGTVRGVLATDDMYLWDAVTSKWINTGIKIAAFNATANAAGLVSSTTTSGNISTRKIALTKADATNPGGVSADAQTFGGDKTFNGKILAAGGVDVAATVGTDVLNIGTTNADTINIGNATTVVNIYGTVNDIETTDLKVEDKLITLNKGGLAATGNAAGLEIEENTSITGYIKTSADRNSYELKAPNTAGIATVTPGAAGITLDQSSHNPVTITDTNSIDLSLSTQVISADLKISTNAADSNNTKVALNVESTSSVGLRAQMPYATTSADGSLSSTDWNTFNNKQTYLSAGTYVKPTYTDNGNGSVTIGSGEYTLYTATDGTGRIDKFTIAGNTFTLVTEATNYIVANYNSGTPVLQSITDVSLINETTIIPVFTIYRNSGVVLHYLDWDHLGKGLGNKLHQSIVKTQRFRRESGLMIGESATRYVTVSSGKIWLGGNGVDILTYTSSTDALRLHYHVGGVWTEGVITQYNNTQYDNGTDLVSLNPNRYAVNFVYRGVETQKICHIVLGGGDYTFNQAVASQPPSSLPSEISATAILVGRIIVQNGATSASQIDSAFVVPFTASASLQHNDLAGLQGGTAGEYYHLTSAQYTDLANTIPITKGGTGGTTALAARQNLGTQVTFNGIEDPTTVSFSYNNSTRVLTVNYGAATYINVGGVRYTKSSTYDFAAHANTTATYYYYIDSSGNPQVSTTPWDILTTAQLAAVYYSATKVEGLIIDERHPSNSGMDNAVHKYLHTTRGAQALSGFAASGTTVPSNSLATIQYAIATGNIADEDLITTATALAKGGPYRIFSRSGSAGDWTWDDTSTSGILSNGTDPYYNQYTGATWQQTAITSNNRWVNYYVVAIQMYSAPQLIVIQGQNVYTTLSAAQAEDPNVSIQGLSNISQEFVYLYRMTYRRATGTTPFNTSLESVQRIVTNALSAVSGVNPADHQSLTNRNATNAHPATSISTDTTLFTGLLTSSNTEVQSSLNTLSSFGTTGDIKPTSFSITNNQAVAADVTGFAFANASVRGFEALVTVYINATTPKYEVFKLLGIQKASSWDMAITRSGDDSDIDLTITSAGQIQYTSANYTGFVSGSLRFRAIALTF